MKVRKVLVYVEGPSDKAAMENLLRPLLDRCRQIGTLVSFHEAPEGDKKKSVLLKVPRKAVNILRNTPDSIVVAMPDLYPRDKGFPHATFEELEEGIRERFREELQRKDLLDHESQLTQRFKVFCFKYDLEVLLLAAEGSLARYLEIHQLRRNWTTPVEDQNHVRPPKRIVEGLFEEHAGRRYKETLDAPLILANASYQDMANVCPQCFGPFVEYISSFSDHEA